MKQVQCSCGKFYDEDKASCPYCGEAKSICSQTEDLSKYAPKARSFPIGVFVFAILNTLFGGVLTFFGMFFTVVFVVVELLLAISSITYFKKRIRNKGLAIVSCILGFTGTFIGIIIFITQMVALSR